MPATKTPSGSEPAATPRAVRRLPVRAVLLAAALCAAGCLAAEAGRVLLGPNTHALIPGRVYRCAQPTPHSLAELVRRYGIRTVVNLRGQWPGQDWYRDEAGATAELGLCEEDLAFSACRLPPTGELRQFIEVLDHADYPLLLHCRHGADRTGLLSVVTMLLQENTTLASARGKLSPRYGYLGLGRQAYMAEFVGYYEAWLHSRGEEHTPDRFRRWALHEYRGGHCRCAVELCRLANDEAGPGRVVTLRVRVRNTSGRPWRFSPVELGGVHVTCRVSRGRRTVDFRLAGLLEREVPTGESIELLVPLPGVQAPGCYQVTVDMVDRQMAQFSQIGSPVYETEIMVKASR